MTVQAERVEKSIRQRLLSVLLVVVIPLLFAVVLLGLVLQLLFKVPVWSTATSMMGLTKTRNAVVSPLQLAQERVLTAEQNMQSLQAQNSQLKSQLATAQAQLQQMRSKLSASATQSTNAVTREAAAKQEATVFATMDPTQAALVMEKLSVQQAAEIVVQMDATTAGPILAAMDPKLAGQVLTLSVTLKKTSTIPSTSNSSNQTAP